ncbi:MAG: hypothetical protein ACHQEM_10045 [Chitinophagales bacterium]
MKKLIIALLFLLGIPLTKAFAQNDTQDTGFYQASINQVVGLYYKTIAENAHLYNGSEYMQYIVYNPIGDRNPFFLSIFMQNGSIFYDGSLYNDAPLTYDIYKDVLVSLRHNWNYRIQLVTDKVEYFDLAGHHFVRITEDSTKLADGNGFYENLFSGKSISVLVKRKKKKEERYYNAEFTTFFFPNDHFYIKKDGTYFPVNSKSSVLDVLKDKKKEIRKYLRKNNISFKPYAEYGIIKAAAYYDQIKN